RRNLRTCGRLVVDDTFPLVSLQPVLTSLRHWQLYSAISCGPAHFYGYGVYQVFCASNLTLRDKFRLAGRLPAGSVKSALRLFKKSVHIDFAARAEVDAPIDNYRDHETRC